MESARERRSPIRQTLFRQIGAGSHLVQLPGPSANEVFLGLSALPGESATNLFQRLYAFLAAHPELRIVRQDVFGVVPDRATNEAKAYRLNGSEWPVTWVAGGNGDGPPVAGLQIHALNARAVRPVLWHGRGVGAQFEDEHARYCVLAGLRSAQADLERPAQASEVLELMERILAQAGFTFHEVVRTWFYLDNILDWYGEFNQVRNRFFAQRAVSNGRMPASTGVGGRNAAGTAVVADLLAMSPKHAGASWMAVPSPLQSTAADYGSAFSRAVELCLPGQRRLYVSGTASILPDGRTAHPDDVKAQVALTMDVVQAILQSRGMTWTDAVRGIAYFKHTEAVPVLGNWLSSRGLADVPIILAKNDICRDDLLFELELDAVVVATQ